MKKSVKNLNSINEITTIMEDERTPENEAKVEAIAKEIKEIVG